MNDAGDRSTLGFKKGAKSKKLMEDVLLIKLFGKSRTTKKGTAKPIHVASLTLSYGRDSQKNVSAEVVLGEVEKGDSSF